MFTIDVRDSSKEQVRTWMDSRGYDFPVLWNDDYTRAAGVSSYPTNWVVDREGRIVFDIPVEPGNFGQELRWRVEAVLGG